MFVKISSAAALPDYILLVGFTSGEYKQFDLKPLIDKYAPFKSLAQVPGLYEQVKIDAGGYGLIWNDDLDISADGIYEKGTVCSPPNDIDMYRQKLVEEFVKARKNTEKGVTDPQLTTLLKMLSPLGLTLSITSIRE